LSEKYHGEVSNVLGADFLEKVYENALNIELQFEGVKTLLHKQIHTVHPARELDQTDSRYYLIISCKEKLIVKNRCQAFK